MYFEDGLGLPVVLRTSNGGVWWQSGGMRGHLRWAIADYQRKQKHSLLCLHSLPPQHSPGNALNFHFSYN